MNKSCLSLSLVHGKLFLFHSLQLGPDAEFGGLKMENYCRLPYEFHSMKYVNVYPWKCSLTFFWSFANLFSYFETFFSVGLMLKAQSICFLTKKICVNIWQKITIIQHDTISSLTHQLQLCTIIPADKTVIFSNANCSYTYNFPRRSFTAIFSSFIWRLINKKSLVISKNKIDWF